MQIKREGQRRQLRWALLAMVALAATGALTRSAAVAAEQLPPAAVKEADEIYKSRCTLCHGAAGKGDGPTAAALTPKPRTLTDAAWQKTVDDAHIEKIILNGGPSVGKSPLMPANPDLANKPDVIKALRQIVRQFGKPA
ncbi:MAG: c-type cytochrome [Deltaproteobacteria bacterium]|nr:c-type cytochrome [Deltaproteobacteria bacterium]